MDYETFLTKDAQDKWDAHIAEFKEARQREFLEFLAKMEYSVELQVKQNYILKGLFEPCEDAVFQKGILVKIEGKPYRLEGRTMLADICGGPFIGYLESDKVVWF